MTAQSSIINIVLEVLARRQGKKGKEKKEGNFCMQAI